MNEWKRAMAERMTFKRDEHNLYAVLVGGAVCAYVFRRPGAWVAVHTPSHIVRDARTRGGAAARILAAIGALPPTQ